MQFLRISPWAPTVSALSQAGLTSASHALQDESPSSQDSVQGRRRRLLKDRFVKEESDYGRVNYGLRIATMDRHALVNGLISRK